MVDTLARSDQDIDANLATLSKFGRYLVADGRRTRRAAGDLFDGRAQRGASRHRASRPRRRRRNSPGSSTATPWCWRACCCPRVRSATGTGGAAHCWSGLAIFGAGFDRSGVSRQPGPDHRRARRRRCRRRVHHACDAVAVDRRLPEEPSATRPLGSGPASRVRARSSASWGPGCCCSSSPGSRSSTASRPRPSSCSSARAPFAPRATRPRHRMDWVGAVADRRGRRGVRVRRHGSAGARVDASGGLGLHGGGCRACGGVRGGGTAAHAIPFSTSGCSAGPTSPPGRSASPSCSSRNFGFFFVAMQYMQLILGYSPLHDRVRARAAGGADHGSGRDDASLPAEGRAANSGRARPVPHRGRAFPHALPRRRVALHRPRRGRC